MSGIRSARHGGDVRPRSSSTSVGVRRGLIPLALLPVLLIAPSTSLALAAHASPVGQKTFRLYGIGTAAQFINHADDRARGDTTNPFNADPAKIAAASQASEKGKGPYPGDDALYRFKLYRGPNLHPQIGTAVLSCVFNFKHQALCEATFVVTGGSFFASGPTNFDSASATLAVTGGTGTYLGATGEVVTQTIAKPGTSHEELFQAVFA
jgi:hypothetical protein